MKMGTMEKRIQTMLCREPAVQEAFRATSLSWIRYIAKKNGYQILSPMLEKQIHIMGSLADGLFSARFYSEEATNLECDFLLEVAELQSGDILPVPGKPGFYSVKTESFAKRLGLIAKMVDLNPSSKGRVSGVIKEATESGILPGDLIKILQKDLSTVDEEQHQFDNVAAKILKTSEEDDVKCIINTDFNGPAVTLIIEAYLNGKLQYIISIDIVLAVCLNFWPSEATEWHSRKRKWPPQKVVDGIKDLAIHLVAKPVDNSIESLNTEWRLTFMAEKKIIQEWSSDMKLTYYIFKILFYAHFIKEIQGEKLSSYLAKTTMYWACEECDPNNWTKERMAENLKYLLHKLLYFLKRGHLPHYFVPAINLLSNVPKTLLSHVLEMDLSDLLEDPIKCIPQSLDHVRNRFDMVEKLCPTLEQQWNEGAEEMPDRSLLSIVSQFLKTPEPFEPLVDDDLD